MSKTKFHKIASIATCLFCVVAVALFIAAVWTHGSPPGTPDTTGRLAQTGGFACLLAVVAGFAALFSSEDF